MAKSLFDLLNEIYTNKNVHYYDSLSEEDKKGYNAYMINRFISMNPDYIPVVNEIQQYSIDNRASFMFYQSALPKRRQYYKYIKSSTDSEHSDGIQEAIRKLFNISKREVAEILPIYFATDAGKEHLREILRGIGWNEKQIKKEMKT